MNCLPSLPSQNHFDVLSHDAASLFDNNNNIEITSEASQSPTSESKGMFDKAGYSGEEEVDKDNEFPSYVSISSQRSSKQLESTWLSLIYFTNVIL